MAYTLFLFEFCLCSSLKKYLHGAVLPEEITVIQHNFEKIALMNIPLKVHLTRIEWYESDIIEQAFICMNCCQFSILCSLFNYSNLAALPDGVTLCLCDIVPLIYNYYIENQSINRKLLW